MTGVAQTIKPKLAGSEAEPTRRAPTDATSAATPRRLLQAKLDVGGVNDPEEREADHAAATIVAGGKHHVADPGGSAHLRAIVVPPLEDPGATGRPRRAVAPPLEDPGAAGRVRRAPAFAAGGEVTGAAAARVEAARASPARPLPPAIQARLEHGFGQSLANVRVHTGPAARAAARGIGARAFTEGERITLGHGESEHDLRLMAHEATHVMQNRRAAGIVRPLATPPQEPVRREAAPVADMTRRMSESAAETRRATAAAPESVGPVRRVIRRSLIGEAIDWLADKANLIPGYRLLTVALGFNPINGEKVERSGANILRGAIAIIPLGDLIVRALDQYNAFDKAGAFVDKQMKKFGDLGASIKNALSEFLDSLSWTDAIHPIKVLERAIHIFADPAAQFVDFLAGLAEGLIDFVKDAVLKPLAALAAKTPAWDILVGVLGKNPITKEEAPAGGEAVVGALLKLAGQDEIAENMKKARAFSRIGAWFKSVVSQLVAFVKEIPALFINALKSFQIKDLLDLPGAIGRVVGIFGNFAGRFIGWVLKSIWTMLEIVFDVVSPGALEYIKKTGAAMRDILRNPIPFVKNLVAAAKLGLNNFLDHFVDHLKAGLLDWLTGSLPGVYIPQAFSLLEFGKFALSVLGITWGQIRGKIVKALGPNGPKIMAGLEAAFDVVMALKDGGVGAAWNLIKEKLTNLKDTVVDGVIGFVKDSIISQAVPKLVSMFIPGAGFVTAIISIYTTVKTFIEQLSKIAAVIKSFVDGIVAIAQGQIAGAAKRVETSLAGLLSLAISFLAGFIGLGGVAEKVRGVIKKVQDAVDKALEAAVNWVITKAKAAFAKLFGGKDKDGKDAAGDKIGEAMRVVQPKLQAWLAQGAQRSEIRSQLQGLGQQFQLKRLDLEESEGQDRVVAENSPLVVLARWPHENRDGLYRLVMDVAKERKAKAAGSITPGLSKESILAGSATREFGKDPASVGAAFGQVGRLPGELKVAVEFGGGAQTDVLYKGVPTNIMVGRRSYPEFTEALEARKLGGGDIGQQITESLAHGPSGPKYQREIVGQTMGLIYGSEPNRADIVYAQAPLLIAGMEMGRLTAGEAFGSSVGERPFGGGVWPASQAAVRPDKEAGQVGVPGFRKSAERAAQVATGEKALGRSGIAAGAEEAINRNVEFICKVLEGRALRDESAIKAEIRRLFDQLDQGQRIG